jgi:hypothetical protein
MNARAVFTTNGEPLRARDSALCLPLVTAEYIDASGDAGILDTAVRYCRPRGTPDYFDNEGESEVVESVYHHCLRAFRFTKLSPEGLVLGKHGNELRESILYFSAAKQFLKHVKNPTLKRQLIDNMETIKEAAAEALGAAREDELKMPAYLAGLLDFYDRPASQGKTEEYIDRWISEAAARRDYSPLLYKLIVNRVAGLRLCGDKIAVNPALMKNLHAARVRIGAELEIQITRTGDKKMIVDGHSYFNMEYIPWKSGAQKKEILLEI